MMSVEPQGEIYICNTPLEKDYKNELTFNDLGSQLAYFNSTIKHTLDNYTYIRKESIINVGISIDKLINCNYLFYKNTGFTNKYYYCFISDMQYVNENCTAIKIETDCFQTWQFDINYKMSFVEREHVNDDSVGTNTIPENLETGEYELQSEVDNADLQDVCPVVATTVDPEGNDEYGSYCGNKYEALGYYIFRGALMTKYDGGDQAFCIKSYLDYMASNSKTDAIKSIFMAPKKLVGWTRTGVWSASSILSMFNYRNALDVFQYTNNQNQQGTYYDRPITFSNLSTTRPTTFGNYTPKNNKLFTFPYSYMNLTNNNGGNSIFKYEDFNSNTPTFDVEGIISPSCSIRAIPLNYKKLAKNYNYGLQGAKYPICSWLNDIYTNWLTQQAVNIGINVIGNVGQIISGVALASTGAGALAGAGSVAGGIGGIANTLGQIYQHSLIPPQAEGNINGGDIAGADSKLTFTIQNMQVREEYARVIDGYFSMFGYKVNKLKLPNIRGRANWNYVKTIDINLEGEIPQKDLSVIKDMFNNGVTLWHNPNTMYDYSQNNGIV